MTTFKVTDEEVKELNERISVKFGHIDKYSMRILTHCDVNRNDIQLALKKIEYVCKQLISSL